MGHNAEARMWRRFKLVWVEIALREIFHARTLTLGGTGLFQISLQLGLCPSGLLLVAPRSRNISVVCRARWYALLTENIPLLSGCHAIKSASFRLEVLILTISAMSLVQPLLDWISLVLV
jgi:hypothetical protein